MANKEILHSKIESIADSVRVRTGKSSPMSIEEIASAIESIGASGGINYSTVKYNTGVTSASITFDSPIDVSKSVVAIVSVRRNSMNQNINVPSFGVSKNGAAPTIIRTTYSNELASMSVSSTKVDITFGGYADSRYYSTVYVLAFNL